MSIIEIGDGVIEVLATNGDTHLGGDDFDNKVIDWMVSEFKKQEGIDLSGDKMAMQRLKEAAEEGEEGAVQRHHHQHQPALYHRDGGRPEAF